MAGYVANTDQILLLVDKAKKIGERIEQRIAVVEGEIAALHMVWDGAAAQAHRAKLDTWHREMKDMRDALAELESATRGAADRYLGNVARNQRMWPS